MHSLGDVWHLGSEDLESLSGSLLCRIWRIWSLWGPVSLAALFLPIFMHSFGDVWHLGSEDLESLQVLGPCYLSAFLRSVSGALGGPQCHLLQGSGAGSGSQLCIWSLWCHLLYLHSRTGPSGEVLGLQLSGVSAAFCTPSYLFMHSLGDVWHLGSEDLESLQVLGPCYLYAFLRWFHLGSEDLESLPGSLLCRIWRIWSLWGPWGSTVSLAALFLPIFMHSLGDVWHLALKIWSLCRFWVPDLSAFLRAVSGALGGPQCHLLLWGPWGSTGSGGSGVSGAQCHLLHSFFLSLYAFLR